MANVSSDGIMPTFTIGTGSVYQANATPSQISSEIGIPVGYSGNATYQLYSYTIPVSPNSDYLTVLYNSTSYFDPRSDTPGTYYVFPREHAVTFFNLSGFTSVSLSLDEISPEVGQPVPLIVQPEESNNSVIISNSHLVVYYSVYGSSVPVETSSYSLSVTLPYGSTASFFLYNGWDQLVGTATNVSVLSTSSIVDVSVRIATLSFDFLNATQEAVSLTSNGITVSGLYGSAQVAIGYSYTWSTSVYDSYTGRNANYTGSVVVTQAQQVLTISTDAAASSLTVYVDSYGPSQQGQLGAPGEPVVNLYIDGVSQPPGQTYVGFVGSTYQVKVTDVLGQLLYENNVTLRTTVLNYYANITVPSWQWSIQNEEQIPASSPLAIEDVSVRDSQGAEYNFTNDIGQQSVLYLKQGNYSIHAKDNATFSANISLTSNQNYVIFAQDLLTYSEFITLMGTILNNTQGLRIQTVSSESLVTPGQPVSIEFSIYYANSTQLDHSALSSLTLLGQVTNSSGLSTVAHSFAISQDYVFFNFSAPSGPGQYTASIDAFKGSIGGQQSYFFTVQAIPQRSVGMNMTGSGPSGSIDVNVSYNFTLLVYYSNGSLMDHADTLSVFANLTFQTYNGVDPAQYIEKLHAYNGTITFSALFNRTGTFSILASSHADLKGGNAYAHALIPVSVVVPTAIYAATLTGSTSILTNATISYVALITSAVGTNISTQDMWGFSNASTLQVMLDAHTIATLKASTHVNSTIYFAVNITSPGNYTFVYQTSYRGTVLTSILFVRAYSSQPLSHDLVMTLTGPTSVESNSSVVYTVEMLIESNGQTLLPSISQTEWLLVNTTYQVTLDGSVVSTGHPAYSAPGEFSIVLTFPTLSTDYSLIVTTGNTTILGSHVWARASLPSISVVPYNPSNPPTFASQLRQFLTSVDGVVTIASIIIPTIAALIYRRITRKHRNEVADLNEVGNDYEAMVIRDWYNGIPLSPRDQAFLNAIPQYRLNKFVEILSSGRVHLAKPSILRRLRGKGKITQGAGRR